MDAWRAKQSVSQSVSLNNKGHGVVLKHILSEGVCALSHALNTNTYSAGIEESFSKKVKAASIREGAKSRQKSITRVQSKSVEGQSEQT